MRYLGVALLFVASTAVAETNESGPPLGPVEDDAADGIIGGTQTTVGQHPSVVALLVGQGICTGTLIDPEWVLTAAHCVDPEVVGAPSQAALTANTTIHFNTVNVFQDEGRVVRAAMTIPKASFNLNNLGSNDIGLIKLATPVTDIAPTPVNLDPAKAPVGIHVDMVGFGATAQGGGGSVGRQFQLLDRTSTSCAFGGGSNTNLLCFNQTDGRGKCQGDSGGPSFAVIDGVKKVVGVTSFGDQTCSQFGADTRTDIEREFLLMNVPQLEGCDNDAQCEPGICFNKQCIAQPFTDGGLGDACVGGAECDSGSCAMGPGGQFCIENCVAGADNACPDGFDCLASSGGGGVCWPASTIDDGGCCDTSGRGGPTALLAIGFIAFAMRRRRR